MILFFCLFYLCMSETSKNQIKVAQNVHINVGQKCVEPQLPKKTLTKENMDRRDSIKRFGSWQCAVWVWKLGDLTGQWPLHLALLPPQDIVFWPQSVFNYSSCPSARQMVYKERRAGHIIQSYHLPLTVQERRYHLSWKHVRSFFYLTCRGLSRLNNQAELHQVITF